MQALSSYILEKLDTLVVVIDFRGAISYVNPAVKQVLGYEPDQLIGQRWMGHTLKSREDLFDLKTQTLHLLRARKTAAREQSFATESRVKTRQGREVCLLWNLSLGPENSLVGIGQDITERKRTEDELKNSLLSLREKNKEVIDSIRYSERIQRALLPRIENMRQGLGDAFVLFKPKDIVSGDFYWYYESGGLQFVAAIDCTGHGVPGALMTMLANSLLKSAVRSGLTDPGKILQRLDAALYEELNERSATHTPDGMDIALCVIDREAGILSFSGAFRPLVRIRQGVFEEFKGARYPIGFYSSIEKQFESTQLRLEPGDTFYLYSDGYVDQFGGQDQRAGGKKFNKRSFRQLLLDLQGMTLEEQEGYLEYVFNGWKQQLEQTDDVLVLGFAP